jgi:hypothetical protein
MFRQVKTADAMEFAKLTIAMRNLLMKTLSNMNAKDFSFDDAAYVVDFITNEYTRHTYENWLTFNYLLTKGIFKFYPTPCIGSLNAAYLEYAQGSKENGAGCDFEFAAARYKYLQDKNESEIMALRHLDL